MTATYDLETDVGKIRALIGDRDVADAHFNDEELEAFLGMEDDVRLAAAIALEAWAAELAQTAHDVQLGDYREVTWQASQQLALRAKQLREAAQQSPAFATVAQPWDGPLGFTGADIIVNKVLRGEVP